MKNTMIIILILILSAGCGSESGKRTQSTSLYSWEILGFEGTDGFAPIYYTEMQDYLIQGFTVFSPEGYVSMSLDEWNRYEIHDVRGPHIEGLVSFQQAFEMFLDLHEEPLSLFEIQRQTVWIPTRDMQMPVD